MLRRLTRLRHGQANGFALPMAMAGALVLLLSSLSIHGAALQHTARVAAEWRGRQRSDQLDGAAQRLAAALASHLQAGGGLPQVEALLRPVVWPLQLQSWSAVSHPTSGATSASFGLSQAGAAARRYGVQFDAATGRVLAFAGLEP